MHEAAWVAGSTPVGGFHCSAAASLTDVRYHLWDQTRQKFIKEQKTKKKKTLVNKAHISSRDLLSLFVFVPPHFPPFITVI